ncbi:MAG TPA: heavy metal-responsive transcriptional regulator [Blastocatellia bacterium]|jgi:DNA-binding transcriptional MerR regulator|nr:heavy metal-responsive transcriptional regulator [Blastocatellia bacterium]
MNSSAIRIGEVALRSGVSIDTVRYYERRRLLPAAPRTGGGFRLFTPGTVERVRFIKQAQELGFSLDEIGDILATGGANECRRVRDHLKVKLNELDERIRLIRDFRKTLARRLAACERELSRHADDAVCPARVTISRADSGMKKKR